MIFYFTSTGNSKYIAEKISEKTEYEIKNIAECVQKEAYSFILKDGERVGFIVPVYFCGIPLMVTEFLKKLKLDSGHFTYAVLDYGSYPWAAEEMMRKAYKLDSSFTIHMPENYAPMFKMPDEKAVEENLTTADKEIEQITNAVLSLSKDEISKKSALMNTVNRVISYPVYKLSYINKRNTSKFTVNDDCIGCGLCESICPRKAIVIENGKPTWQKDKCELCLGCLQRCPKQAINYGKKTLKSGRYVNPKVKL